MAKTTRTKAEAAPPSELATLVASNDLCKRAESLGSTYVNIILRIAKSNRALKNTGIMQYYSYGQDVHDIIEQQGAKGVGLASEILGISRELLYSCSRVARAFTEDEVHRLCTRSSPINAAFTVSWSHLNLLATEGDAKRRKDLVERMFANGWSTDELDANVQVKGDGRGLGAKGAPVQLPKDIMALLDGYRKRGMAFGNYGKAAVGGGHLAELIDKLAIDDAPEKLFVAFNDTRETLEAVYGDIAEQLSQLKTIEESVHRKLEIAVKAVPAQLEAPAPAKDKPKAEKPPAAPAPATDKPRPKAKPAL